MINPSFNDIQYFVEIAKAKNITRAAHTLKISQPSLSTAINRLESQLGHQLLIRSRSGVTLTKAGKQFFTKATDLLHTWQDAVSELNAGENEVQGTYTLGAHVSVASYTLPKLLPELYSEFPGVDMRLHHNLSRVICEKVISYEIDFGIVVNPVQHADLVIKKLFEDQVTFWKCSKQPSAFQSLTGNNTHILCDRSLTQTNELLKKLLKATGKSKVAISKLIDTPSLELIRDLTLAGVGIGILPTRVAQPGQGNSTQALTKISRSAPVYKDEICLVYRYDFQKSSASKALIKKIQESLKSL